MKKETGKSLTDDFQIEEAIKKSTPTTKDIEKFGDVPKEVMSLREESRALRTTDLSNNPDNQ